MISLTVASSVHLDLVSFFYLISAASGSTVLSVLIFFSNEEVSELEEPRAFL